MNKFTQRIKDSFEELTHVKVLAVLGMLGALSIIINSFTIQIGDYIKIGFAAECNVMADCLFGPVAGAFFGGAMDILKFFIKPTGPFFFGWTLSAMLSGVIYGIALYHRKITLPRILIVRFINSLLINVLLGTFWLKIMYGYAFFAYIPTRAIKNLVMWPIESIIFFAIYKALEKSGVLHLIREPLRKKKKNMAKQG